ncbi:interactor of HORMAD1 protein 1 isoform X2 [Oryzias latipes]|uniref:interactor of HORMAD1 protein 1 isoform X2 n=1 Tax=Oryzias latipes TaxID=8090 RepID=UPI0005CBC51D|nr:interactor of HORMAD1 protein 1 isoform X2 [Oryzias latipes]
MGIRKKRHECHTKNKANVGNSKGNQVGGKSMDRNGSNTGLTDSQLLFGSQFWFENSQNTSQDLSLSSRNSQQSLQEGSDPKFYRSYLLKPLLFGDYKDKTNTIRSLDQFEEDKRKTKENNDIDFLARESQHVRETLCSIHQLVASTKQTVCQAVFDKIDNFASTLQSSLKNLVGDISQKFETLVAKANSQRDVISQLEEKMMEKGDITAELHGHLQSLKNSLDGIREEQERKIHMLEEAVQLLQTLASELLAKPTAEATMHSATQTSPNLEQPLSNQKQPERAGLQVPAPPQDHKQVFRRTKPGARGLRRRKKRALVLPQRSKRTSSDENRQPLNGCNKPQRLSEPVHRHQRDSPSPGSRRGGVAGCFITPLSSWSVDSSGSECFTAIEPILEKLSAEPKTSGGFWQLFDSE